MYINNLLITKDTGKKIADFKIDVFFTKFMGTVN